MIANDKIGGIADITEHFAEKKISIESILMKEVKENNTAEIVIVTDKCKEKLIKEIHKSKEEVTKGKSKTLKSLRDLR